MICDRLLKGKQGYRSTKLTRGYRSRKTRKTRGTEQPQAIKPDLAGERKAHEVKSVLT